MPVVDIVMYNASRRTFSTGGDPALTGPSSIQPNSFAIFSYTWENGWMSTGRHINLSASDTSFALFWDDPNWISVGSSDGILAFASSDQTPLALPGVNMVSYFAVRDAS
ncbi:hypothetical protein SB778_32035 [Paraburkholderia sp. SIMBA_050]